MLPLAARIVASVESVSLHVRRGDYASDPKVNAELGVLPLEYYAAAIEQMRQSLSQPEFFVFSNDPDWCAENLRIDAAHTFVTRASGSTSHDDLQLMSTCRHHVISNSSFGWWGAGSTKNPTRSSPLRSAGFSHRGVRHARPGPRALAQDLTSTIGTP